MSGTLIFIFSIAMFINIVTIYYKIRHGNVLNALVDFGVLVALSSVFGRSTDGMAIATIVSALFSAYLLIDPIQFNFSKKSKSNTDWMTR
jgi:hypothetical protein